MRIVVIIVTWNAANLIGRVLGALSLQSRPADRVLIIDNGSSDGDMLGGIVAQYPFCELNPLGKNLGFAAANNIGVSQCDDAEFVALLNPDAFPEPHWLEALLSVARENSECDVFGSKLVNATDPSVLDGAGDAYHISGLVWRERHGARESARDCAPREIFSPCAAAALYRRQALMDVGLFDEDYFCYVEDVDLGFRLRLAGHKALYVPDAVVHHVGSATTGGKRSDFSVYHGHRNLVWTFVKDMPGILFWLLLPLHILMNLASILWFALQGRGGVILRAKRDALLGLPKMWHKRQKIQSTRIAKVREIWRYLDKQIIPAR
ncbi:MAG: glycosyltransferase family 2 protein [Nitrospira sp.]|nr:glycosyltransferase family 2 protein [Nitrospira sp.]MDH4368977.1 glycosyltransferase family 2 protein [Nitrospira sp.]MDH5347121.1 glycosyltransferase family 2 protein [Nitrospira sp.]MDH5496546.1 glycosyltransferase family 2 protein [Nitrospira sp.]MDH5725757.1 glycosyltransferase family 2 protein [Nitrospira sp.]